MGGKKNKKKTGLIYTVGFFFLKMKSVMKKTLYNIKWHTKNRPGRYYDERPIAVVLWISRNFKHLIGADSTSGLWRKQGKFNLIKDRNVKLVKKSFCILIKFYCCAFK